MEGELVLETSIDTSNLRHNLGPLIESLMKIS
jgi:hypothetical protein